MLLSRLAVRMSKTAMVALFLVAGVLVTSTPASAAATYTFYVNGSSVGQTSPAVAKDYTLNLTNLNSSASISFNLSIVSSPLGWTTQLSQASLTVGPSATRQITLTVQPPAAALADAVGQYVNVSATPDDNTTAQIVSTTTRVTEVLGVQVTLIPNAGTSGDPGVNITWLAYVKNTGNSVQSYNVNINNTSFTSTNLTTSLISVSPGDTRVILVTINISATAPVGTLYSRITATASANSSVTDAQLFAATVNAKRAVGLSGLTPDDLHVYTESEASVVVRNILVENKGNVADSYTLLGSANASRHGDWIAFETSSLAMSGFTQRYLNVTVTVPASITQTGDYTAEFRIISDNSTSVIAFLNLTITVTAKHDLSIVYESLVAKQSGEPGTTVAFPVNVSNPGAFNQRIDLYYVGANSSWLTISANPFTLAPGASKVVYYNFSIPGSAAPGAFTFTVLGTINWTNPYRNRTVDLTLDVAQVYDTLVSSSVAARSGLPGATVDFIVNVRNNGTGLDNFTVTSANTTQAGLVTVIGGTISLASGASGNVTVRVALALTPPPAAGVYYYTVTAKSSGNVTRQDQVVLALTVNQTYSLSATMSPLAKTSDPGAVASFTVSVVNNGNGADTVTLERAGLNQSWVSFPVGSGTVAAGARMNFTVEALAPSWADPGSTLLSVKTVSGGDANVSSTTTFTLSLNAYRAFQVSAAPGNVANAHRNNSYSVDVTLRNSGNLADTYQLYLDGIDASWTSLPFNTVVLQPNVNSTFTLTVAVPGLPINGVHVFYINVSSVGNSSMWSNGTFTVTVNDVFKPEISVVTPSVFALPGATVNIVATVRNNGSVPDSLQLTVTTPVQLNQTVLRTYTLGVGAGGTTTVAIVMNYPYTGTYQVVLTLMSLTDNSVWATSFVNITMEVRRGVDLVAWFDAVEGGPNEIRNFSVWINNTGNITDTFFLDYQQPAAGWTVWFSDNNITLASGQSQNITVFVQAAPVAPGQVYSTLVRALSRTTLTPGSTYRIIALRYTVSYLHTLTNASASPSLLPGQSTTVTVVLSNDGTSQDDYTLLPNGTAASWGQVTPTFVTLDPHTSTTLQVDIAVPSGQHEGARTLVLEARSTRGGLLATLPITVTVGRVYGLSMVSPSAPVNVTPGQSATFDFTVFNNGNANDTYSFVATPGTYANFSAPSSTADAGQSLAVTLRYTPPAGAATGTQVVEVSVYGGGSQVARANVTVVVRQVYNVTAHGTPGDLFYATGAPGSQVQLTFNISNRGNGPDQFSWGLSGPAGSWAQVASGTKPILAGSTDSVTLLLDIPSDPTTAVAGLVELNVTVTSLGGGSSVFALVHGGVTVAVASAFTASFDDTAARTSLDASLDRGDSGQHDYTIYLHNNGNRAESLTLSRAQISGWSIILLVSGQPGSTVTVPIGGTTTAVVRIASFPQSDPGQTVGVTVRTADGLSPPVTLQIKVDFLEPKVEFASTQLDVSSTSAVPGSIISVTVTVRNAGNGTSSPVTVRLIVDGQENADTKTLPAMEPGRRVDVTLSWTITDGHAGKSHSLSVEIPGVQTITSSSSVSVPEVKKGLIAKLSTDQDVQILFGAALVLGLLFGAVAFRRRKAAALAPAPRLAPAPPPPASPEAAMEGLAALEAEGMGAQTAIAPDGPASREHKIVCPNCGTEQWIAGAEGECKTCGVVIEISEEEDAPAPPSEGV